jgi:hypothetical protein
MFGTGNLDIPSRVAWRTDAPSDAMVVTANLMILHCVLIDNRAACFGVDLGCSVDDWCTSAYFLGIGPYKMQGSVPVSTKCTKTRTYILISGVTSIASWSVSSAW